MYAYSRRPRRSLHISAVPPAVDPISLDMMHIAGEMASQDPEVRAAERIVNEIFAAATAAGRIRGNAELDVAMDALREVFRRARDRALAVILSAMG